MTSRRDSNGDPFIDVVNVGSDRVARAISQYGERGDGASGRRQQPDVGMNDPRFALLVSDEALHLRPAKFVLDRGIKEYKLGNAFPARPGCSGHAVDARGGRLRDTLTLTDTS